MTLIAIRSFNGHDQWLSDHEPTLGSCRVPAPTRDTRYRCEDGHLRPHVVTACCHHHAP